eukprot:NODE_163_length_2468_cov_48.133276_g159_i0.p1 GENE.NODE_163_length_2468_cov_48.133276_g159_i0~~NODE_163_length_2468_cov_48.133276_g159_i0.p1  ORF type:complete len:767 (+),score=274.17 NODE_163_length_2468_cov_48.133276_g159_i0:304-2301(+)
MALDGRTATGAADYTVTVTAGQSSLDHDFAFSAKVLYAIGDTVFEDTNKNGQQDSGEAGLAGVVVELLDAAGHATTTATTDASGKFTFDGNTAALLAKSGVYSIRVADASFAAGAPLEGRDATTPEKQTVTLTTADHQNMNADFGFSGKATFTIGDTVFNDVNQNGGQDAGDAGLAGVTVLLLDGSVAGHPTLQTKQTDANGKYSFTVTTGGKYMVELEPSQFHSGKSFYLYAVTTGNAIVDVTVGNSARTVNTVDFGLFQQATYGTLGDSVFADTNGDGVQNNGEVGIPGILVELRQGANVVASDVTDATGKYTFDHGEGDYEVRISALNFAQGNPLNGQVPTTNLGSSASLTITNGVTDGNIDFGFAPASNPGTETGVVYQDTNLNGVQDAGEPGLPGVTVQLTTGGHTYLTTETNADGTYTFSAPGGSYDVSIEGQRNFATGEPLEGRTATTPQSSTATITAGGTSTANFGYSPKNPIVIGDEVFEDADDDGVLDQGEKGIAGVVLNLLDSLGNAVASTQTNADGGYFFEVHPGTYTVQLDDSNFQSGGALATQQPLQTDTASTHTVNYQSAGVFSADFRYSASPAMCRCQVGFDDGATSCGVAGCSLPLFSSPTTTFSPPSPWDLDTELGGSNYVVNQDGTISLMGGKWLCTDVVVKKDSN